MLSIGVAQTRNSTSLQKNFEAIVHLLKKFESANVDLVLFPECSLSGCSAKMMSCTEVLLSDYLQFIQSWANDTGKSVVLPTAIVEGEKVFNSVYWFQPGALQRFFKTGLTPSEQKFFSIPSDAPRKIIRVGEYRCAILICREAQDEPWCHFSKDEAELILWPGYWGWTKDDEWEATLTTGEFNSVMENMKTWQLPLIQSNFAFNDLEGYSGPGPIGRSVIVDSENKLAYRGAINAEQAFVVELEKSNGKVVINRCRELI